MYNEDRHAEVTIVEACRRGAKMLELRVFVAGFSVAMMIIAPIYGLAMLVVAIVYLLWSLMAGLKRMESYFKGAKGEERVAEILKGLPDAYHVFNDFTVGRKHIDHVVVGPVGVFAIETKFWNGRVTLEEGAILLDGQLPDRSPLLQVNREAMIVRNALAKLGWDGIVTSVLTFASNSFVAHRAELNGTVIMNANELHSSFNSDRIVVPPAELVRLVRIMENYQR